MFSKSINRLKRLFWYLIACIVRTVSTTHNNKVLCIANNFNRYDCHPKFISEYIISNYRGEFEIVWAFRNPEKFDLPRDIKIVKYPSIRYLRELYSSKFIICNRRMIKFDGFFIAKPDQKYIMTWHDSGFALKKIEKDAESVLAKTYIKDAKLDSSMCSLMLSGSKFQSDLIRKSFWYDGEILEKGLPRVDYFVYAKEQAINETRKKFVTNNEDLIVLYAPTFRNTLEEIEQAYLKDWSKIAKAFNNLYHRNVKILVRFHPNLVGKVDVLSIVQEGDVQDVSSYENMQELLLAADILITDYSSCMFDFALMNKICFLYASDYDIYDRGFYFDLKKLPFCFASTERDLLKKIENFNTELYRSSLNTFMHKILGIFPLGIASESVVKWMLKNKE